ncbi:Secreted cathepsin L 1 [Fasciola gigantica]|uniref:Secreted cathepsin L 1 n=1 Tax=Fasciola gigantica TaxID=46835 RepID=A0A504YXG7_FASGI|nr:Secreted cathepsin L 1 [Fasciola gigantica]
MICGINGSECTIKDTMGLTMSTDEIFGKRECEKHIQEHNLRHDLGLVTYTLGLNQVTDMTFEEFKAKYLTEMQRASDVLSHGIPYEANKRAVPDKIDWRESGYVTEVKDQGNCGSCWAFSTTGTTEGQYMKKQRTSISFFEQQLVDCSGPWGNMGCSGGLMENAYEYLKQFEWETESSYPYRAKEGQCRYNRQLGVAKVTGYYTVQFCSEVGLKNLVVPKDPAVAVDRNLTSMMVRNVLLCSYGRDDRKLMSRRRER